MSSSIYINISNLESGWNPIVGKAQKCTEYIDNSKKYIEIVRDNLDYRIKNKNGIGGRVESISKSVNKISEQIENIETFLNNSISKYTTAEQRVNQLAIDYGILEPKKKWYEGGNFNWDKALKVGEATFTFIGKVAASAAIITAALAASGPVATALLVGGSVVLVNEAVTAAMDVFYAFNEEYDSMGFNLLKSVSISFGGYIGSKFGYKEIGEKIGQTCYSIASIAANTYALFGGVIQGGGSFKLKELPGKVVEYVKGIRFKDVTSAIKNKVITTWNTGKSAITSLKSWSTFKQTLLMPTWTKVSQKTTEIIGHLKGPEAEIGLKLIADIGQKSIGNVKKIKKWSNPKEAILNMILPKDSIEGNVNPVIKFLKRVYGDEIPNLEDIGKITKVIGKNMEELLGFN